jgi:antitoxin VapB
MGTRVQLNIKSEEAYRLAREVARRSGESLTQAVTTALRERLERQRAEERRGPRSPAERLRRLEEIAELFDDLPVLDDREPDEIIGYDENGLPS